MDPQFLIGNSLEVLQEFKDNSIDSIVTDPPYGLSFMGRKWDYDVPSVAIWEQCLRVLKPGGHLLAFAGTRTQHRMVVNIEDAGFEIRDMLAWVYSTGFPKSHNVSKAIDKAAGAEREVVGVKEDVAKRANKTRKGVSWADPNLADGSFSNPDQVGVVTAPATPEAQQWDGWGTALKPALEPITVARKPFQGTVANNVLEHGTGALNIDGCRVAHDEPIRIMKAQDGGDKVYGQGGRHEETTELKAAGRWPANLIHDGNDEVTELFPQTAPSKAGLRKNRSGMGIHDSETGTFGKGDVFGGFNDSGSAARFFYCAKANKTDRGEGNTHPTVKPTDLMAYLCRLVTPPGGVVLDPFMGSGSTGKACVRECFDFIGIDLDPAYVEIAKQRINVASESLQLEL